MLSSIAERSGFSEESSEEFHTKVRELNTDLTGLKQSWEEERKKLMGDNAVLQDAATRLNAEMREAKDELRKYAHAERANERARADIQSVSESCFFVAYRWINGSI